MIEPRTGSKDRGLEASNIAAQRGLNENFARELLELYSLGEGNYTEQDVREMARALTGYQGESGHFVFDAGHFVANAGH